MSTENNKSEINKDDKYAKIQGLQKIMDYESSVSTKFISTKDAYHIAIQQLFKDIEWKEDGRNHADVLLKICEEAILSTNTVDFSEVAAYVYQNHPEQISADILENISDEM